MSPSGGYSRRLGVRLLDTLKQRGKRIFTTQDAQAIATELGIPSATLSWLLHELAASAWTKRLRRGLYVIDESGRGGPAPHPFAIATALVTPSAISHWSALAHHGLTEQVPRVITVSTPKDVVTPRMRGRAPDQNDSASTWEVDGLAIRYIRIRPEQFWGFESVWVDEFSRVPVTDRERTVLDGFIAPRQFGSLQEVLGVLVEHLEEIDLPRLVDYAVRYGQSATVKRLGYVLEQLGVALDVLRPLRAFPIRGYRLLDPQAPSSGPRDTAWHIRDNLTGARLDAG